MGRGNVKHRVEVARRQTYAEAEPLKRAAQEANPESEFQIRKKRGVFVLVERVSDGTT